MQEDEQQVGEEGEELRFGIVERRWLRGSQTEMSQRSFISWRGLEHGRDVDWK